MKRAVIHTFLSLLLTAAMIWGGCLSCPRLFSVADTHSCCKPSSCEKPQAPVREEHPNCENQPEASFTFVRADSDASSMLEAPLVALDRAVVSTEDVVSGPALERFVLRAAQHSPPDLYLVNSVFRI